MPDPAADSSAVPRPQGSGLRRWLRTRDWLRLLLGVPAMLAVGGWIWVGIYLMGRQPARIEREWLLTGVRAGHARDFKTAALAFRALVGMQEPPALEHQFRLALSLGAARRFRESEALFRRLAPLDRPVYAPAHLHLADRVRRLPNPPPGARGILERQLQNAIALEANHPEAHELLGRMYLTSRQTNEAKQHLVIAAAARGEAAMPLAALLRQEGDLKASRNYVERAQRHYRDRLNQNGYEDTAAVLGLVAAMMELGNHAGALAEVESAFRVRPVAEYQTAIARVCAAWVTALARERPDDGRARLEIVERGLAYAPQDLTLLLQLIRIGELTGAAARSVQLALDEMLAAGGKAQFVHLFCGLRARGAANAEAARQHIGMALDLTPGFIFVANNLALVLAFGAEPDLERALNVIEPVVERAPTNPRVRDTRGHILSKLGRHAEAVKDLEFSVQGLPPKSIPPTCLALADSYTALGNAELTAKYERIAASFGVTNRSAVRLAPTQPPAGGKPSDE